MSNSYRIRTQVGVDKSIRVQLDQDFEFLEILSLKIVPDQVYTRSCSDYGVVIGRVSINDGYGLPNCKVSIFIPLSEVDSLNPIIADLYPYTKLTDLNDDGYRYNLLPYKQSYSNHTPTGTFFTRNDVLVDPTLIEVYDKYYRYTAITNDSGDFMIFGVPVGSQTLHLDVDLSDIGEFSLSPQDLIRMGVATEAQVSGTKFKSSTNLNSLPQIISINKTIEVEPFWGQEQICNIGITRTDFDLTNEANIVIEPTAVFIGSIFSDNEFLALKRNCKPRLKQGELCNLVAGPGQILAIRQTIQIDSNGRPILEEYRLDQDGQVIDENGAWMVDVPMNLDFVTTNEFGERVFSSDPKVGIPTSGKYRFKIKWNQSPSLSENIKRAYFLVPNIRENGWDQNGLNVTNTTDQRKSYAFSLDWNDYANIPSAIKCEDTFYPMKYNKVYTVSQLIDQWRSGSLPNRFISVKNILDDKCESENNKFPTNDAVFRGDIIYLVFTFFLSILRLLIIPIVIVIHVLMFVLKILKIFLGGFAVYIGAISGIHAYLAGALLFSTPPNFAAAGFEGALALKWGLVAGLLWWVWGQLKKAKLNSINLPTLLYDQCEFCNCNDGGEIQEEDNIPGVNLPPSQGQLQISDGSYLLPRFDSGSYGSPSNIQENSISNIFKGTRLGDPPNYPNVCNTRVPGLSTANLSGLDYFYFSSSLTLSERINLFNTKAKYFDQNLTGVGLNPGGGVNRIRVRVEPTSNYSLDPTKQHFDNVICLILNNDAIDSIKTGELITFQDPTKSFDVNVTGGTFNQFGNNSSTGTSLNLTNITINYANPSNPNVNIPVTYTIPPPSSGDTNFVKFPTDIEYFQVITAMTYSQYSSGCSTQLQNSLYRRYLNNIMRINRLRRDNGSQNNCATEITSFNKPIANFENYTGLTVVFLVRGVDPYSTRVNIEYDLSRLFGYNSYGNKVVSGSYKLNIPIQKGLRNVRHNLTTQITNDLYSGLDLYYDSFNFRVKNYSGFTSVFPKLYSSLDNGSTPSFTPSCNCSTSISPAVISTNRGLSVSNNNDFTREWNIPISLGPPINCTFFAPSSNSVTSTPAQNRGYYSNEIVEGGSLMFIKAFIPGAGSVLKPTIISSAYFSPQYPETPMNFVSGSNFGKIIMRSDRLPTSSVKTLNCGNSFVLQQNINLAIYSLTDDGTLGNPATAGGISYTTATNDDPVFSGANSNPIIDSLNDCSKSRNLDCYEYDGNTYKLKNGGCDKFNGKLIYQNGCYKLVTSMFISILKDIDLVYEWASRTSINFGACRNVWSHIFTNNWVNGSLYVFAFKNDRFFNSQNIPSSNFCRDVIYLDSTTNNFYYRSSPYDLANNKFVGGLNRNGYNNTKNLKYPTTIMDLGPRDSFTQELIFSDEYDGYVVNKLKTTTFNNVTDILNILVISRLINTSFIAQMITAQGANIFSYFSRNKLTSDGDYSQMISINSELGVDEFDSGNYPDPKSIYINTGKFKDVVIGLFFSSDTQVRDYITPKRTLINPSAPVNNTSCVINIPSFSQVVPFYQWETKTNSNLVVDSIFGSQKNTWFTDDFISNEFFVHKYQTLDRLNPTSRYFRPNNVSSTNYFKGYIYGVDNSGNISPSLSYQNFNSPNSRVMTVGAPFHFYFGLKKGKSAWDVFAKKWINFDKVVE